MDRKLKVLLVEDEPLITLLYEQMLERTEFDLVAITGCNSQALTWLQANRPDLAIVDYFLDDGPCVAVMAQLEQMGVPYVVVTAFGDLVPDHVPAQRCWRDRYHGQRRYIVGMLKAFEVRELLDELDKRKTFIGGTVDQVELLHG